MSSIRKAGVAFYPGVGVSPDLTGLADTISLKYKMRGNADFTDAGISFTEDNAGTYTAPLTLSTVGDYIVIIESTDDAIENLEGNVLVTAASIDDVNDAVTALQSDMTAIKTQIDVLDEAELNGIAESVKTLTSNVESVRGLIQSGSSRITVDDANRANELKVGDIITDADGTEAVVTAMVSDNNSVYISYDAGRGDFNADTTSTINYLDQTDIAITGATPNAVDSVMEFVESINAALNSGGDGLEAIAGYTDNLELMLEGKEYKDTEGNTVSASDSKGLAEIYSKIGENGSDVIASIRTIVEDIRDELRSDIYSKIDGAKSNIIDSVTAVKDVVDANKAHLENAGYGLDALKTILDDLATSGTQHDTDIKAILADGTNGLEAIKTTIMNKLDVMDGKLDNISGATGSRIFI